MEARFYRAAALTALVLSGTTSTQAGSFRTNNFVVSAPTAELAQEIGEQAEKYRRELAIEWIGKKLPTWSQPCPITVQVAPNLGAGGATSFLFERGEVFGWKMTIQGSRERILDSVLPHEVTHTIFATHFRRPLPRWADEGACTTVEHTSERTKQQTMLVDFLRTGRGIPFSRMFAMRDYPNDVMPLYSQGYSLARYLIAQGGKHKFMNFVADGLHDDNWQRAVDANYGFADLGQLQNTWLEWVRTGSPNLDKQPGTGTPTVLASNNRRERPAPNLIQRSVEAYPLDGGDDRLVPVRLNRTSPTATPSPSPDKRDEHSATWHPRKSASSTPEPEVAVNSANSETEAAMPGPVADGNSYEVTRPQPTEHAQQIILEWSKP